jgi:hypothetical protein
MFNPPKSNLDICYGTEIQNKMAIFKSTHICCPIDVAFKRTLSFSKLNDYCIFTNIKFNVEDMMIWYHVY